MWHFSRRKFFSGGNFVFLFWKYFSNEKSPPFSDRLFFGAAAPLFRDSPHSWNRPLRSADHGFEAFFQLLKFCVIHRKHYAELHPALAVDRGLEFQRTSSYSIRRHMPSCRSDLANSSCIVFTSHNRKCFFRVQYRKSRFPALREAAFEMIVLWIRSKWCLPRPAAPGQASWSSPVLHPPDNPPASRPSCQRCG